MEKQRTSTPHPRVPNQTAAIASFPSTSSLFRVFLFGRFRIEHCISTPEIGEHPTYQPTSFPSWRPQASRQTLAYVLCQRGRQCLRDQLLDALWPETDLDQARKTLTNALSSLRTVLRRPDGVCLLTPAKIDALTPITLAGQEAIWCDLDAFQERMTRAQQSADPFPLWEQAWGFVQEDFLLDDRYADWTRSVRAHVEGEIRLCAWQLSTCYREHHLPIEEERLLRLLLHRAPDDEDVLARFMKLLSEQGRVQEALHVYRAAVALLREAGEDASAGIQELASSLQTQSLPPTRWEKSSPFGGPLQNEGSVGMGGLEEDQRHLVGRENWVSEMQTYVLAKPAKKLVVVQAALGAGKSSSLHLLSRTLRKQLNASFFFLPCTSSVNMTAEEHLTRFLAELSAFLGIVLPHMPSKHPLFDQTTHLLLHHLARREKPTVLFLDNGEVLLQENGQLAPCWQHFFSDLLRYEHSATLFLATREWPGWTGRHRAYLIQNKLPPLSPEAGAAIWRRMGFADVDDALLQHMSERCGGNPWLIELRASTLQEMPLEASKHDFPQENPHTLSIKNLLGKPHMFGTDADRETRHMLQEVMSQRLSPQALLLLELLACSQVALPFSLLEDAVPQVEERFEELQHASLVDLDARIYAQRARLHPVVVKAAYVHQLSNPDRRTSIEDLVLQIYTRWRDQGIENDQEKSAVTAELIIFDLHRQRLLSAAERLLQSNISLARFGHTPRIARLTFHLLEHRQWPGTLEQKCGATLLRCYLAPVIGQTLSTEQRAQAYHPFYDALLQQSLLLQTSTELYLVRQLALAQRNALHFSAAEALLTQVFARHPDLEQTHPLHFASLLAKKAELLGAWSDYIDECGEHRQARALREQTMTLYRQGIACWEQAEEQLIPGRQTGSKYNRAMFLNDLAYYLRRQGQVEEALAVIERSLSLKSAGYAKPGSLAAAYGEKAQILATLGRFREALHFDQLAVDQIQQEAASSGNSLIQSEIWVYLAERGQLYLRLGRLQEAEHLFEQAARNLRPDRRPQRVLAETGLAEIQQWRQASPREQLDWRWAARYRELVHYDAYAWWTPAAFSAQEQEEWTSLLEQERDEASQRRMEVLLAQSRDREILAALSEQREPRSLRHGSKPCDPCEQSDSKSSRVQRCQPRDVR